MSYIIKHSFRQQIKLFKQSILQLPDLPFSDILSTDILTQIVDASSHQRDRIFTPLVTLKAFMLQVLNPDGSCRQAVNFVLAERLAQGEKPNSNNTSSYCKARANLPLEPLINAVEETGKNLHDQADSTWRWQGHNVVIVDGTTVLMADTPDNQKEFPQQSNQKPGLGFPIARLVGLISLSTGAIVSSVSGCYQGKGSGETSLFSVLFKDIPSNDILLADRYYCTWAIIASLFSQCSHILVQNHAQRKPNFSEGKKLGAKDHIVEWKKPKKRPVWMNEEDYRELPDTITIREFAVGNRVYVTTLLNAKKYHKKALATLYKERWSIELDLRSIKTHMGMEMLRCKSAQMVRKEIAIYFLSYNLTRANMARSSIMHEKNPRQYSFMTAVQLYNEIKSTLLLLTGDILKHVINHTLEYMVAIPIGRQKRKNQPRAIKRRPKPYPLLMQPREDACNALNNAYSA